MCGVTPEPQTAREEQLELMLGMKVDMKWAVLPWKPLSGLKCERL